jgi:mRNA-degrading endonuclease RelE of RelBE toxin-antitoxin system
MRQIVALPSFARSAKRLSASDKSQLAESLEQFNNFILSGEFPVGLGFKKIGEDKYEFRAGLRLRVIVKAEGDTFYLVLVGSHDEVSRYLRR